MIQGLTSRNGYKSVAAHALFWLVCANLIGLSLSLLLLFPNWNAFLGSLSYGHWVPLHLNFQLYGWVSIPLLGLIFRFFYGSSIREVEAGLISGMLWMWSTGVGIGGVSWLNGSVTGKVFLDWKGPAAAIFLWSIICIWILLLRKTFVERAVTQGWLLFSRSAFLFILFTVPIILFFAIRPEVYPSVNPLSGGPTGVSLLGSTLGAILLFILAPSALTEDRSSQIARTRNKLLVLWGIQMIVFGFSDHGDASHRESWQIAWLALVLPWPLLMPHFYGLFRWKSENRIWRHAFAFWMALLFASAFAMFLPGINEMVKFTNALVAHAHMALAGLVSSFGMIILIQLPIPPSVSAALSAKVPFFCWNGCLLGMVLVLSGYGVAEGLHPWREVMGTSLRTIVYSSRTFFGAGMFLSSFFWFGSCFHWKSNQEVPHGTL